MSGFGFPTRGVSQQPSAAPKIYIDLTDVVSHAIWHGTCAGIPRVQLEIAIALVRSNAQVVPFSIQDGSWRDLRPLIETVDGNGDRLLRRLREQALGIGTRVSWPKPKQMAKAVAAKCGAWARRIWPKMPRLNSDDTLFVAGAFWISPPVMQLCEEAAAVGANLIVLVHDLIPFTHPEFCGKDYRQEYRNILALPAHFIVTTEYNRRILKRVRAGLVSYDDAWTSVIPLAHEFPGAKRNERPKRTPTRLQGIDRFDFILCVGTIEIRKNHQMLLAAWDRLADELGDRLPPLVVAGRRGWKADEALRRLDEFFDPGKVMFVESPSDEELRWLYAACLFTVFPSRYRGMGTARRRKSLVRQAVRGIQYQFNTLDRRLPMSLFCAAQSGRVRRRHPSYAYS